MTGIREDGWVRPGSIPRSGARVRNLILAIALLFGLAIVAGVALSGDAPAAPGAYLAALGILMGTVLGILGIARFAVGRTHRGHDAILEALAERLGGRTVAMGFGERALVVPHPLGHVVVDRRSQARSQHHFDRFTRVAIVGDVLGDGRLTRRTVECTGDAPAADAAWLPWLEPLIAEFGRVSVRLRPERRWLDIGPSVELWVDGWIADEARLERLFRRGVCGLEAIVGERG